MVDLARVVEVMLDHHSDDPAGLLQLAPVRHPRAEKLHVIEDSAALPQALLAWAHLEVGEMAQAADMVAQAIIRERAAHTRLALVEALSIFKQLGARKDAERTEQVIADLLQS